MAEEARYSLEDFGRPEYKDPLIPIQILTVMMGFTLLVYNVAIVSTDMLKQASAACGATMLLGYMFYLAEYYERIWEKYYNLPEDKTFFRIYCLLIGVVTITLMNNFPQYWYFYTLFLFLLMLCKKLSTRRLFRLAFNKEYGDTADCKKSIAKAAIELAADPTCEKKQKVLSNAKRYLSLRYLAHSFTKNFLWYGVLMNAGWAGLLYVLYLMEPAFDFNLRESPIHLPVYVVVSIIVTALVVGFWVKKIRSGLRYYEVQIQRGNYEYFEGL